MTRWRTAWLLLVALAAHRAAASVGPGDVLVADYNGGAILVVHASGGVETLTPKAGSGYNFLVRPTGVVFSARTRTIYAVNSTGGQLVSINATTGQQTQLMHRSGDPFDPPVPIALGVGATALAVAGPAASPYDSLFVALPFGKLYRVDYNPIADWTAMALADDPLIPPRANGLTIRHGGGSVPEALVIAGLGNGLFDYAIASGTASAVATSPERGLLFDVDRSLGGGEALAMADADGPTACAAAVVTMQREDRFDTIEGGLLRCPLAAAVGAFDEIYVADASTQYGGDARLLRLVRQDGAYVQQLVALLADTIIPYPIDIDVVPGIATFDALGDLPGGTFSSSALAVSSDGSTVVGDGQVAAGKHAFVWRHGSGMTDAGDFTLTAVSANGQIAAGYQDVEAIRFEGSAVGLGFAEIGHNVSEASGISDDGSVITGSSEGSTGVAFRWTEAGGMQSIGDLPGGDLSGSALAISPDGLAIVGYGSTAAGLEAFRWTAALGMQSLGDLPGGSVQSEAFDVAPAGSAVVGFSRVDSDRRMPFRWTPAAGMQALLDDETSGTATAVTANGKLVVGSRYAVGAVVPDGLWWDELHGAHFLADVLGDAYGLVLPGWHDLVAADITSNGRVIAGRGFNALGKEEAFRVVLVVPEPDAVWTGALAALVALGGARAQSRARRIMLRPDLQDARG